MTKDRRTHSRPSGNKYLHSIYSPATIVAEIQTNFISLIQIKFIMSYLNLIYIFH